MQGHRITILVNARHIAHECGNWLECYAHGNILTIADTPLYAARMIGLSADDAVLALDKLVHHFASPFSGHTETVSILKSVNRRDAHHGSRHLGMEFVEDRFAQPRRYTFHVAFNNAAQSVTLTHGFFYNP